MELYECNPFIRFADKMRFEFQRGPSKTYDCRMLYAFGGSADVEMEGVSYSMNPGSLVLFQPGTEYTIRPQTHVDVYVFDFDFLQDYSNISTFMIPCTLSSYIPEQAHRRISFTDAPLFDRPVYFENISFIEPALQEIVSEYLEKRLMYRGKISTLFKSVLFDIARFSLSDSKSDTLVSQIMQYIDSNLSRHISNQEIGAYFNYNPNHLNRLMLRHTGKTLHRYILRQRISKSLKLIQTTNMTMAEIAASLGFNSPSHFSCCFKKETGFSPMQFRDE